MKKLFVLLLMFLAAYTAQARKFYFSSSTGNDSYTSSEAQNPNTPWKTLAKISYYVIARSGNLGTLFQAGDTLAFKRGDVFDNGLNTTSWNGAVIWWNYNDGYYRAPSGTPSAPIVFTNYGDPILPLPNFYYTLPAVTQQKFRNMFSFSGVHDIVVDGLQFNDTRFSYTEKKLPAYTYSGILLGEWTNGGANDTSLRKYMVTNATVKNCIFSSMSFGFAGVSAINSNIINNTFSNFKGTEDTVGFTDVLGGAIEGLSGFNVNISNNYIKGAWSGSGRVSDCNGLGGVGLDIFWCFKNSRIAYNTFEDCSGVFEVGNRYNDTANGAQYDTFAFNKIINCGQFGYLHGTAGDVFKANNHHLYFWNNVAISNNKDRMVGNGFGDDIYGDGQSFNNFWFFRSKYKCPDQFYRTGGTTAGSTIITFASTTGFQIGTRLYDGNEVAYRTITNIGVGQVTVDNPMTVTNTTYGFYAYAPISDLSWSYPTNAPLCNSSGYRSIIQFPSDSSSWGLWADTMIAMKNNIFYATNGGSMLYPNLHGYSKQRYFHNNNIYYIKGGFGTVTSLGGTLGSGEYSTTSKLFVDTSASLPINWDFHLAAGSLGISAGLPISGFTKDFDGNNLTNPPSIGLYNYGALPSAPTVATSSPLSISTTSAILGGNVSSEGTSSVYRRGFMYSLTAIPDTFSGTKIIDPGTGAGSYNANVTGLSANTSYHVRAFALSAVGVAYGADVIFNTLPQSCTFTYGSWSTCNGTTQTRSYVSSPSGCAGTPPIDSVQRACTIPCTSFTYGAWSVCSGNVQTRTYTASPANCTGTPPVDSVTRSCVSSNLVLTVTSVTKATCTNKSNGAITVAASGGIPPYYYSINSTTNYILNQTTFTGIKARTTNTVRVKDSRGVIASQSVYVGSVSSRSCP